MRNHRLFLLAGILLTAGCTTAPAGHPTADQIAVEFEVVDNHQDSANSFKAALTLINKGTVDLGKSGWTLYFNFVRMPIPESVPAAVAFTHINGDFFKLEPTEAFAPLPPGARLRLVFDAQYWIIKEAEAPAGFYVVFTDAEGQAGPPEAVTDVTVVPMQTRQQTDRMQGDNMPVPTAASRYADNLALTPLAPKAVSRIIPTPTRLETGTGTLTLDRTFEIRYKNGLDAEAAYLADALEPLLGARLTTTESTQTAPNAIVLNTGTVEAGQHEAYRLAISADAGIGITGSDAAGVFYGIQSLRAWLPAEAYQQSREAIAVDEVAVSDAPRFAYRGQHLDVARNFQSKETVKKLLDLMAFFKLNKLHFHLTDDEGWRLAIDGLPALTEVGGRRGHTLDERDHLVPSFGSGPDPDPAASNGSGFYTRADFVDILRHARSRHIEVIPEIDMPGPARAAIKAMQARQAGLMAQGRNEEDEALLLNDPEDASDYLSVQMWTDNVINVCQPATYRFFETVVDALVTMYAEADAPLTTIHTGGDEVPHGVWEKSPACQRLIDEEADVAGTEDLFTYFLRRISNILDARGLVTAGWEEIALKEQTQNGQPVKVPNEAFLDDNFQPYVWNTVLGWGAEDTAYKLANAGFKVVMANATNLYFDLSYDKDPRETGYYWAAFVDTKKPFELVPLDLYKSAWQDRMGNALDPATAFRDHTRLTDAGRQNILGIQGQLWAENAKGPAVMEYLAFPKILGLAERAWAPQPAWATVEDDAARKEQLAEAWNRFAHSLGHHTLPQLDYLYGGVAYRLPPPGAIVEDGVLKANAAFPGLTLRYTTDGTEPSPASTRYDGPVAVTGTVKLKTFDTRGRGSRTAVVAE